MTRVLQWRDTDPLGRTEQEDKERAAEVHGTLPEGEL